jgi:hypothetical protein
MLWIFGAKESMDRKTRMEETIANLPMANAQSPSSLRMDPHVVISPSPIIALAVISSKDLRDHATSTGPPVEALWRSAS